MNLFALARSENIVEDVQIASSNIYLQDFPERKSSGEPKSLLIESIKLEKNELITLPIKSAESSRKY